MSEGQINFEKLEAYSAKDPDTSLQICKAADYYLFGRGVKATKEITYAAVSDRAVVLFVDVHHTAWAISQALKKAGILHGKNSHRVAKSSFEGDCI